MNCLASIVKYILYIFNIIFLVCGILLIVLGGIMLSDIGDLSSFDEVISTDTIPILILILGCIIFVISFFGCCGAIRENKCCMMMYSAFMFIIFCLQVALVVWVFVEYDQFVSKMDDFVNKAWAENTADKGYPMDALQLSFKCCGVNGYQDYTSQGQSVPNSCCGSMDNSCTSELQYINKPGCLGEFHDFWATNMNIIRYAGIGVALVELVAFTFACYLTNSIRRN